MQKNASYKKSSFFKNYLQILPIFGEKIVYLWEKNSCNLKNPQTKFRIGQFVTNSIDFWRYNSVFCKPKLLIQKIVEGGGFFLCSICRCRFNGEVLNIFKCSQKQQQFNIQSLNQPTSLERENIFS